LNIYLQCEIEGVAEEVGGISAVEVEVEVASAEEVEDGGFSTVEVGGVTGVSVESAPSNCSVTQASVSILINPIFTQVHQHIVSALFVRHKHHTLIRIKNK
jgi:hypothetical protein